MDASTGRAGPTRKTRFVCVSDTHTSSPLHGAFKLPTGDVLIHAGDLSNQGSLSELRKTVEWIEQADFEAKIVVAGNHDITLDEQFYQEHGLHFHNQHPQDSKACIDLLANSPSITYLNHQAASVKLTSPNGPHTSFKVFGSPYSPARGLWAFQYQPDQAQSLWQSIPLDTDICITHTPPKLHCDEARGMGAMGCEVLRRTLWCVRPRLAVCGHVHEGRGVERVRWRLDMPHISFCEAVTTKWVDPGLGNKKQSLIDLTAKGGNPLDNDGAAGNEIVLPHAHITQSAASAIMPLSESQTKMPLDTYDGIAMKNDFAAIAGRMGRRETCVINASIMASSWQHRGRYNKPIVVDIDLPIWTDASVDP